MWTLQAQGGNNVVLYLYPVTDLNIVKGRPGKFRSFFHSNLYILLTPLLIQITTESIEPFKYPIACREMGDSPVTFNVAAVTKEQVVRIILFLF